MTGETKRLTKKRERNTVATLTGSPFFCSVCEGAEKKKGQ